MRNKIYKDLKIGDNKIGNIIFKPTDLSVDWIEKIILSNIKKLEKFYKIAVPKLNIELIYFRKEFDKKSGWQTPDWMVGSAWQNNIFLFSPSVVEEVSIHKKLDLKKIIIHELCHIFNQKINENILTIVDEGLALFLAGQKKNKITKLEWIIFENKFLRKNVDFRFFSENGGYKFSYWFIKKILQKNKKNKVRQLLEINCQSQNIKKELERIGLLSN